MTQRRNDPVNNGFGHYRQRKVINLPAEMRFGLDRYEQATLRLIADLDAFLAEEQQRTRVRRGDPGE
ncbi:hypothetical protein ACQP2Y_21930 [Actinoplanes sp. CA-051413]|uniref:hypothetical protein n=1 Tax=Actinoplanes sp. CA-051413 TaxID=3239899 RepID=UPI003D97DDE3